MLRKVFSPHAVWIVPVLVVGAVAQSSSRTFQILLMAAMVAALGGAGRRIACWMLPDADWSARWTAAFSVAVGLAAGATFWLGHFGSLRPDVFLISVAGLYLMSLWIPVQPAQPAPVLPRTPSSRAEAVLETAAWILLGVIVLATLVDDRYQAPGFHGFDDLSYHLAAVATWHQYGDLRMMKFPMGDPSTSFYPILAELCSWVLIVPFGDSDVAARWTQLPFALFSGLALFSIARRLGLPRRASVLAAVSYLSIRRVLPLLAFTAGNDHTAGFFALAGLDAVLAASRRPSPGTFTYAGLTLGLLAGTKYLGILQVGVLVLALLVLVLAHRKAWPARERPWGAILRRAALLLAVALLAGGYTYLRNAWSTGNPVFPSPVEVAGVEIFEGWVDTGLQNRLLQPEAEIDIPHFLLKRRDLFGPSFRYTLLPAALLAPLLVFAFRKRVDRGIWPDLALVLVLPAVFFLIFLFGTHDHRDMRYFLPGVALAGVAFAWLLELPGARTGTVLRSIAFLLPIHHLARRFRPELWQEILGVALLLAVSYLILRLRERPAPQIPAKKEPTAWRRWAGVGGAAAALSLSAAPLGDVVEKYQVRKLKEDPAALALEQMADPGGVQVAYVGWNQPYRFFGSRLQNQVEYVPYEWNYRDRFFDWGMTPELPFNQRMPRRWIRLMETLGIDYVVIVRAGFEQPERRWIATRPWRFEMAFTNGLTEVWRVLPQGRQPGPQEDKMRADDDRRPARSENRPPRRRGHPGARPDADRDQRLHPVAPDPAGRSRRPALPGARPQAAPRSGKPAPPGD